MQLPFELYQLILTNVPRPIRAISYTGAPDAVRNECSRYHAEAYAQAVTCVNAMFVCKAWRHVVAESAWCTLFGHLRRSQYFADKLSSQLTAPQFRVRVYCEVRTQQLARETKRFVKDQKLVYRSPKIKRRNDTDNLGMRKLIKLGRDKLYGAAKQRFLALVGEWKRVHDNGVRLASQDRVRALMLEQL